MEEETVSPSSSISPGKSPLKRTLSRFGSMDFITPSISRCGSFLARTPLHKDHEPETP